jgi:hypothetical protein
MPRLMSTACRRQTSAARSGTPPAATCTDPSTLRPFRAPPAGYTARKRRPLGPFAASETRGFWPVLRRPLPRRHLSGAAGVAPGCQVGGVAARGSRDGLPHQRRRGNVVAAQDDCSGQTAGGLSFLLSIDQ